MSITNDCNFREMLLEQFGTSFADTNIFAADPVLLNHNTKILNEVVKSARQNRFNTLVRRKISDTTRRAFRQSVPINIQNQYDNQILTTVTDLIDFVQANRNSFRESLPTPQSVVTQLSIFQPLIFNTFESQYPSIAERLQSGPISSAEVNQLIQTNGFDPNLFSSQIQENPNGVLDLLEKLLSGLGVGLGLMGSFCSLIENVYGIVGGQMDILGNISALSSQFQTIASSISPRLGEVFSQLQTIATLVQSIQSGAQNMQMNAQDAFQIIASAFQLSLSFFNSSTGKPGTVNIDFDLDEIREGLVQAVNSENPGFDLFASNTAIFDSRLLGDLDYDGIVSSADVDLFDIYIAIDNQRNGVAANTVIDEAEYGDLIDYVETVMIPTMKTNIADYQIYTEYVASSNGSPDISGLMNALSQVASIFGSALSPSAGDFGQSQIGNLLSTVQGVIGSVGGIIGQLESIVSGNIASVFPLNIDSLLSQLDNMRDIAQQVSDTIFADFRTVAERFRTTVEEALGVAEQVSVSDPERTREIQENRQLSIGRSFTQVSNMIGRVTNEVIPILNRELTTAQGLIGNIAASGVLENMEQRLTGVVEQSAAQLRNVLSMFSVESLDNGFNFNMGPVFARFAGLRAAAESATTEGAVRHMQNVTRGLIADNTTGFRERNREEVEFVALRLCNFAGEIERLYNSLADPLRGMIAQAQQTNQTLSVIGNEVSARAVAAGAIRLPSSARPALAQTAASVPATVAAPYVDPATGAVTTVPPAGTLPDTGRGPLPAGTPAEWDRAVELFSYERVSGGSGPIIFTGDRRGWGQGPSWSEAIFKLSLLADRWGRNLSVTPNGAYEWRHERDYPRMARTRWSDRNSWHRRGGAFDIAMSAGDVTRFRELALSVGFGGIAFYPSDGFIHVDVGQVRPSWTRR